MTSQMAFDFGGAVPPPPAPASPPASHAPNASDPDWVRCYWWATYGGLRGDWWRAIPQGERDAWLALYRQHHTTDGPMPRPEAVAPHLQASYRNYRTLAVRWALELQEAYRAGCTACPIIPNASHLHWVLQWAFGMAQVPPTHFTS
jgi:hypothetical protein